ncbi:cytochrome b [Ramlibacter sp. MMS24-I3-19]|uniref:cytochrome b n=1 Tax=Ramlibacter sp. MMS24-I3-19 TaxID=3416606 RepID=UPI003CFCB3E8
MPAWFNDTQRYGLAAVLLHWGMAAVLAVLVAMGLYMVALPDAGYDQLKITLILVHKGLGMVAFALAVVRIAWRWVNPLPALVAHLPAWQQVAARVVHLCFYALMVLLPLTGWAMSSAGGYPVPVFGWFSLPPLLGLHPRLFDALTVLHRWLADALLGLLALHAGAALDHHLRHRDDTLLRMLP